MKFGTGSNKELTQKYEKVKVQNDVRTSKHIYKQTNIPDFVTPESVSLARQLHLSINYTAHKSMILHGMRNFQILKERLP